MLSPNQLSARKEQKLAESHYIAALSFQPRAPPKRKKKNGGTTIHQAHVFAAQFFLCLH
jgi:hypothetical protein